MISFTSPPRDLFVLDTALQAEREYWLARLGGKVEPTAPPRDRIDERGPGHAETWREPLPIGLAQRLERISGGSPLLLFAVLIAGLAACLTRWSGRRCALLGSPALLTSPPSPPNLVALLLETEPETPFRRRLLDAREVLREAYSRQRYPWPRLAPELGQGDGAATFGVVAALDGLHGPLPVDATPDLVLCFTAAQGPLAIEATDRGGVYSRTALLRFLAHFTAGLATALVDVDRPLLAFDGLSEAERHQIRIEWAAGPPVATAFSGGLHQLVAGQAATAPESAAVIAGEQRLTYRELENQAGLLAGRLRSLGAGLESRVGVLLARSPELVVALLAVLKTGAAYVPLDPGLPDERLRFLLEDSGAALVLTTADLGERVRGSGRSLLSLDRLEAAFGDQDGRAADPGVEVSPDSLAYVMYTSGSTGRPKGVMVSHRSLVSYLRWCSEAYEVAAGAGAPVHTSIGFDLTVTSLWSPLVSGRPVWLLPDDTPDEALAAARADRPLSLVKLTPSHLELLLGTLPDPALAAGARVWVLGGEVLRGEQVAPFRERAPRTRWVNEYGPTETTVGCSVHEVEADPGPGVLPIGRPIAGAALHLLAPDLSSVPIGEVGEIYVGGSGVARGYWGQPALTAERFVPDLTGDAPGGRLYRTGDLAIHRSEGTLVYVGRRDQQIKIRGQRIEPAEVESVLARHPSVRAAAVVVREDPPGHPSLVAYVVSAGEVPPDEGRLRAHVAAFLPEPMVPGRVLALPALPLTPNGKLDRAALPAPPAAGPDPTVGAAPLAPVEEILAGIWADVLGRERIGRHDDFFDLGGHSLLAAQVAARLRRTLGVEVTVGALFAAPTLAGFAFAVAAALGERSAAGRLPLVREEAPRELSPGQEHIWFLQQLSAANAAFNLGSALRLTGALNPAALELSLAEVMRRHEVLRSAFPSRQGLPVWTVSPLGAVVLPRVDLAGLPRSAREEEARRAARGEAERPLDLGRSPLLRVLLAILGPGEHLLALTVHHIVSDGWSMELLVRELATSYGEALSGHFCPRPEPPIRFADFARWQRRRLDSGELAGQLDYWRSRLAGAPRQSTFPPDRQRGETPASAGALLPVELPAELSAAVCGLGRRHGATVFMVLCAALAVALHHSTGQDDLVLGTDLANRGPLETEDLIGFFVNQLPLRLDLAGDPSFTDILARSREAALGAYLHQEVPFGRIVDALQLPRELKAPPLFQVKLIVLNFPRSPRSTSGLDWTPVPLDNGTAQFDLVLALEEGNQELRGWLNYNTALFDPATARGIAARFRIALEVAVARPELRLSALEGALAQKLKEERGNMEEKASRPSTPKFLRLAPKAVQLPGGDLVTTGPLFEGRRLPLLFKPAVADLDPVEWAQSHQDLIQRKLLEHGGLLFRGFNLGSTAAFERFAETITPHLADDNGELPRSNISGRIYSVSYAPPEQPIFWHSENSFCPRWPMKLWFFCALPAEQGGETPIVDNREVLARLAPEVREAFRTKGIMYLRNCGRGLDFTWQVAFQTEDREEVERRCRESGIEIEWKSDDVLHTRSMRPAIARHPQTGEEVFYAQPMLWHVNTLPAEVRAAMLSFFRPEDVPRRCTYGDGTPISDAMVDHLFDVYRRSEVVFPWQKGDALLLDNMLTSHARNPFVGPRKIYAAMAEQISDRELKALES